MTALAPTLERFFTHRRTQRRASPATVAAYRDAWRLLLTSRVPLLRCDEPDPVPALLVDPLLHAGDLLARPLEPPVLPLHVRGDPWLRRRPA